MPAEFVVTGLLVGILVGLTGMGGGSLMTPILVLVLGVRPTLAVGTDLTYAALTKAVGSLQHFRLRQARVGPALWLSLGSVPASLAGVRVIAALGRRPGANADALVGHLLAIVLIFVAIMLLVEPVAARRLWPSDRPSVFYQRLRKLRRIRPALLVAIGVVVGFLVGITSVGGGSLVMFTFLLLFPKWPMSQRVGTDVLQGCLLSAGAAAAHWQLGTVNFPMVAQLLLGSIPGVLLGSRLTRAVPENVLRPIVAGVLALSGWRLL